MLEVLKKNKMNVVMVVLFGAVWLLIIPVILGIEKISNKYPKTCKWIARVVYYFMMACGAYIIIKEQQVQYLPVLMCMGLVFCNTKKEENK